LSEQEDAETPFFFFQVLVDLLDELHQFVWVLLNGSLSADYHPALFFLTLHRSGI
jgi:hypothetical protein